MSNSMPTVTELVHRYKREEMSYDDLKAAILGRQFDRLPYPLWADSSDYSQWGFYIPGTWHEFIEFYDNGTLSHDEWWGLAGEHPDWSGAIQEEPGSCDPQQGFIEWHRQPVQTANGLEIAVTTDRKGLTESASEDGEEQR